MSKEKPSGIWGIKSPEFFFGLKDQPIHVAITGGKTLKGVLVGVDVYDIVLRQETGLEVLVPKHAIVYVHRAAAGWGDICGACHISIRERVIGGKTKAVVEAFVCTGERVDV